MELEWLQDNGATADSLMDCWKQYLELQGFTYSTYNDALVAWLKSKGLSGALNDMLNNFYADTPVEGAFGEEYTNEFT